MSRIKWPKDFPDVSFMLDIIQKTNEVWWKGVLTIDDVYRWLDNFTGKTAYSIDDERRIALWMLCNFTYYNEDEINYLCRIAYKNFIHDLVRGTCVDNSELNLETILHKVYFAAIGNASESGGLVLYHFRQETGLSLNHFFYPTAIPKDKDATVVFIDDVTLSGGTATAFFDNNVKEMQYKSAYYLTLFASDDAIKKITDLGVTAISSIILDDRDRCFSNKSVMFNNYKCLKVVAEDIVKTYGGIIEKNMPLGYENGQYSFGMCYNTPNNTLPIFWSKNHWTPLFPRKEKKYYDKQGKREFDKYI